MLISLETNLSSMRAEIGEKAYNLSLLNHHGIPVPSGFVLPCSFFHELLQFNNSSEIFNQLVYQSKEKKRFKKINDLITNFKIPESVRELIDRRFTFLGSCVAIRSSSPHEDGFDTSNAGLFQSYTDITNLDEVYQSILKCYASAFTQEVISCSLHFGQSIAVIIQTYVPFDVGGVLVSYDPLTSDLTKIVVNAVEGGVEQIVEGDYTGKAYTFPKTGALEATDLLSLGQVTTLIQTACKLEPNLGYPIDVEWGFKNDDLFLVQVRPIVVQKHNNEQAIEAKYEVSVDDPFLTGSINLSPSMYKAHLKWLNKKDRVRSVCREVGIEIPDVRYLYLPAKVNKAKKVISDYCRSIQFSYIEVYDGKTYTILEPCALLSYCQLESQNFAVEFSCRIQEFQRTEYCGFASIVKCNGNIYIESLPGMFKSFWTEGLTPAVLHLSAAGEILETKSCQVDGYYSFDPKSAEAVWIQESRTHSIPEHVALQISTICSKLTEKLGEVRIEWIYDGQKVDFFDLSEESRPLLEVNESDNYLSLGPMKGRLHRLTNMDLFDDLFTNYLHEIDVVASDSFNNVVSSPKAKFLISQEIKSTKPIIVADFPKRTLAVMADHVSGFIFKRGALLCHLAIILREKGIPAIILPDISDLIEDGKEIQVINGRVVFQVEEGEK